MAVELKTEANGRKSRWEGIVPRHARGCHTRAGGRCACTPSYQAQVWSPPDQKTIRKTFSTLAGAKAWRQESQVALRKGHASRVWGAKNTVRPSGIPDLQVIGSEMRELVLRLARENSRWATKSHGVKGAIIRVASHAAAW